MFNQHISHYTYEEIDNLLLNNPIFDYLNTAKTTNDASIRLSIYDTAQNAVLKSYESREEFLSDATSAPGGSAFIWASNAVPENIRNLTSYDIATLRGSVYIVGELDASLANRLPAELDQKSRLTIYSLAMQSLADIYNSLDSAEEYEFNSAAFSDRENGEATAMFLYPTWHVYRNRVGEYPNALFVYPEWAMKEGRFARGVAAIQCYPTWELFDAVRTDQTQSAAIICYPEWSIKIGYDDVHANYLNLYPVWSVKSNEPTLSGSAAVQCYPTWNVITT